MTLIHKLRDKVPTRANYCEVVEANAQRDKAYTERTEAAKHTLPTDGFLRWLCGNPAGATPFMAAAASGYKALKRDTLLDTPEAQVEAPNDRKSFSVCYETETETITVGFGVVETICGSSDTLFGRFFGPYIAETLAVTAFSICRKPQEKEHDEDAEE